MSSTRPSTSNRSHGEQEPSSQSPKHQKIYSWNDEEVGCTQTITLGFKPGIVEHRTYEGINKAKRSLEDTKCQINNIECQSIMFKDYFYYTGFKKGLATLLSEVHRENLDYKALLIHGIPHMGKTSLAHNLAYHLACTGSNATVVRLDDSKIFSPDHVSASVGQYIVEQSGWIILDQVNVNSLNKTELVQLLLGSGRKTPLIMFTSGQCEPPGLSWTKNNIFSFKVIDLRVDEAGVRQVKEYLNNKQVKVADMLKVTTVMGHVYDCILETRYEDVPVALPRLHEIVYEIRDLSDRLTRNPSVFWMLWPKFCNASPEDIAKANKPEDWKIEPSKVQLLRCMLSFGSDPKNVKSRLFVNWLHIDGNGRGSENQNDGFFVHTDYFYFFPCLEKLHHIFSEAYRFSPEVVFKKCLGFYQLLRDIRSDRCARSVQGSIFESLIGLKCQVESKKTLKGLVMVSGQSVSLTEVDDILTPSTVTDLCKTVEQKRKTNSDEQAYWCDFNSKSNNQFPGYDFAFVQMEKGKYKCFQLFKATVNPAKHRTDTMLSVLVQIRIECKFAHQDQQVTPYFLCPHDDWREASEFLPLGGGSNFDAQVVNMIEF